MRTVLLAAALFAASLVVACGGGDDDDVELPPGDEGAIQQLFIDFVQAKEDDDEATLSELFSAQCVDRAPFAQALLTGWDEFRDTTDIDILSIDFERLEAGSATATPKADLSVAGGDPAPAATRTAELVKEGSDWKLATCDYDLPGLEQPISFG